MGSLLPLNVRCHRHKTSCLQSRVRTEDFYRRLMSGLFRHFVESSFDSVTIFFLQMSSSFLHDYRRDAARVEKLPFLPSRGSKVPDLLISSSIL
jgi:hypothetical protein